MIELNLVQETEVADGLGLLTVGQQLKKARKSLGWDVHRIASRLNMPESYIRFIEKDEFSKLPSATFARGYLHAYAKCMDLPVESIMRAYKEQVSELGKGGAKRKVSSVHKEAKVSGPVVRWTSYGVGVLSLALSMLWWQNQSDAGEITPTTTDSVTIETADGNEIIENLAANTVKQDYIAHGADLQSASFDANEGDIGKTIDFSTHENVLEVFFADSSWIEIKDASSHVLFTGIKKMGEHLLLKNISSFDVAIGNAAAVKLSYNGAPVDLSSHVSASNAAKITLGL